MNGTVILVSGSRHLTNMAPIAVALSPYQGSVLLVHGAAPGADTAAERYAGWRGWGVLPMPAQWERNGNAAGPKRNQAMLEVVLALGRCGYRVVVHAFPGPRSRGTWDMVRRARDVGLDVVIREVAA